MDITNKEAKKLWEYYNEIYDNAVIRHLEKTNFDMYQWISKEQEKEAIAIDKIINQPFSDDLTEEEEKIVENLLKGN
jgi:hemerythrin-like domain-containing protein